MSQTTAIRSFFGVQSFSQNLSSIWRWLFYVSVATLFILLSLYVFQIQEIIRDRYNIKIYSTKVNTLSKNTLRLEAELSSFSYLNNLAQELPKRGFVKVDKVVFLPISAGYLASIK